MPTTPRTARPGAGPGRGRARTRATSRAPRTTPVTPPEVEQEQTPEVRSVSRTMGITRRAMILAAVVAFLLVSFAGSLRIYFDTERQSAERRAAIQRSQQHIDELNAQIARWDDPDFAKAQARERLGWVMPGETGYRVIGADGKPVGTRLESTPVQQAAPPQRTWWQRVWGSVQTADRPAPTATPQAPSAKPSERPPLTDGTRTPTPKKTPTQKP